MALTREGANAPTSFDMQRYHTDPAYREAVNATLPKDNYSMLSSGGQTTPGPASPGPLPGVPVAGPTTTVNNVNTPNHAANAAEDPPLESLSGFDSSPGSGLFFQLRPYLDVLGDKRVDAQAGFRVGRELAREFFPFNSLGRVGSEAGGVDADPSLIDPTNYLRKAASLSDSAGGRSAEVNELIRRRMEGLGGLTQEENQALKDRGETQLNQALRTGIRAARARTPGLVGPASGIAFNPVVAQFAQGQKDLARDLTIANIDAKEKALSGAESLVRGAEGEEFNRRDTANKSLAEGLSTFRNDLLQRKVVDLQNLAKEKAGQIGLLFGAGQFGAAQAANREASDISREAVNKASNTNIPGIELPDFGSIFGSIFEGIGGLLAPEEDEEVAPLPQIPKPTSLPKK